MKIKLLKTLPIDGKMVPRDTQVTVSDTIGHGLINAMKVVEVKPKSKAKLKGEADDTGANDPE